MKVKKIEVGKNIEIRNQEGAETRNKKRDAVGDEKKEQKIEGRPPPSQRMLKENPLQH